jgi:hypothetical protein
MKNTRHYYIIPKGQASRHGQTVLETAVLIVILVAALVAMQVYMKRGIQGRLRENMDSIGGQYDPERTTSDMITNQASSVTTTSVTARHTVGDPWTGMLPDRSVTTSTSVTDYENSSTTGHESVDGP